ncbi:MAG: hypothetical protein K6U89_15020 [Chloroflexi bacterium]|nr:hypothetical protein [Chloroflexota bacterium]
MIDQDPAVEAFARAPIDAQPLIVEELAAIEEARQEVAQGKMVSTEEARPLLFPEEAAGDDEVGKR